MADDEPDFCAWIDRRIREKGGTPRRTRAHRRPVRDVVGAILDEAEKRGKAVSSINADGVTVTFGAQVKREDSEVDDWINKHAH